MVDDIMFQADKPREQVRHFDTVVGGTTKVMLVGGLNQNYSIPIHIEIVLGQGVVIHAKEDNRLLAWYNIANVVGILYGQKD